MSSADEATAGIAKDAGEGSDGGCDAAEVGEGGADALDTCAISRVDSLTLALEAIQRQEASARLLSATPDASAAVLDLLLDDNANSRDRQGADGSSADDEEHPVSRRATSLKVPSRQGQPPAVKKAVRFADAMGLDLTRVRHVLDLDSPPVIPPQAMRDLVLPPADDSEEVSSTFGSEEGDETKSSGSRASSLGSWQSEQEHPDQQRLYLSPSFAHPGSAPNFKSRVTAQKVVLEKAYFHSAGLDTAAGQVRGLVRVANLGFEKIVRVRATFNDWRSCLEVDGVFQPGGGCGASDQFAFSFGLPDALGVGDRVALCVSYAVNGQTYWDNNFGDNYSFHCVAISGVARVEPGQGQVWSRYV